MNKKEKLFLLKTANQMILHCGEFTPPEVTYSELNYQLAQASEYIQEIIKLIKKKHLKK